MNVLFLSLSRAIYFFDIYENSVFIHSRKVMYLFDFLNLYEIRKFGNSIYANTACTSPELHVNIFTDLKNCYCTRKKSTDVQKLQRYVHSYSLVLYVSYSC